MRKQKLKKKLNLNGTFTKMVISYFYVIFISIALLTSILYLQFSKAALQEIQFNIQDKLNQNVNGLQSVKVHIDSLGLQLLNDSEVISLIYQTHENISNRLVLFNRLSNIVYTEPSIHSIYVYNGKLNRYLSNLGDDRGDTFDQEVISILKNSSSKSYLRFIPHTITYKNESNNLVHEKLIMIIYPGKETKDQNSGEVRLEGAVVINLKADVIQKTIISLSNNARSNTYITDKSGLVVYDSFLKSFGENISGKNYMKAVFESNKESGNSIFVEDNKKYLITYISPDTLPYTFINVSEFSSLLGKVYSLRLTLTIICTIIITIAILLSLFAARNVYLPFNRLIKKIGWQISSDIKIDNGVRKYNDIEFLSEVFSNIIKRADELKASIQDRNQVLKKVYLKELLSGNASISRDIQNQKEEIKLDIDFVQSYVIDFCIDGFSKLSSMYTLYGIKSMVNDIINDILSKKYYVEVIDIDEKNTAVIIFDSNPNENPTEILDEVNSVKQCIKDKIMTTVTVAIGLEVYRKEDIHLSYSNCVDLLKYRFVFGYDTIITNAKIEASVKNEYVSIEKNKDHLIKAIKTLNNDQMEKELDEIFEAISVNQYDYIKLVINQVVFDILSEVNPLMPLDDCNIDYNNIYSNLNNIETLQEVRDWLVMYCTGLIDRLDAKKVRRKKELIERVVEYINKNYASNNIFTEQLAEMVNLTPGYFGKIFNNFVGKSANDYIIEVRMHKAKELLLQSNTTINDISSGLGFANQQYFTTIFKKYYGTTPNQFRKENKIY